MNGYKSTPNVATCHYAATIANTSQRYPALRWAYVEPMSAYPLSMLAACCRLYFFSWSCFKLVSPCGDYVGAKLNIYWLHVDFLYLPCCGAPFSAEERKKEH